MDVTGGVLHEHRDWLVVCFLVSFVGLTSHSIGKTANWIKEKNNKRREKKKIIERLSDLTPHETNVLQWYLQEENTTGKWGRAVGPVEALARDGILSLLASGTNPFNQLQPDVYAIHHVAWKHLHEHPELIGLTPQSIGPSAPSSGRETI